MLQHVATIGLKTSEHKRIQRTEHASTISGAQNLAWGAATTFGCRVQSSTASLLGAVLL